MSALDLEAEYNNRARVPESSAIIAGWAKDAAAYREAKPPRILHYGASERQSMDLFEAGGDGWVMFVHGGYWQALDKSYFSHMARGLNQHGVSVAVPSYDLCPHARIGDIIEQIRTACAALHAQSNAPIIVSGHSAGGHLAACMLATEAHVPAAYAISGVFELGPLIPTSINGALGLDEAEADALSPLLWPAPEGRALDCVVGGDESGEFLRQSQAMAAAWGAEGVDTRYEVVPNANHFTVIAPMADPASKIIARLKALAEEA